MLNSEPSTELDKQQRNTAPTTAAAAAAVQHKEQTEMAATEAGSPRRLGLNLNLSVVQPHAGVAYHWPHSTVADDASPSGLSKGTDDDDDDDRDCLDDDDDIMDCRRDNGECSPVDEQDILEMQREERETLNQLARQLASGSRLMAPMLQHLVYQHPGLSVQPSALQHQHHQQLQQPSSQQQHPPGVVLSLTPAHRQSSASAAAADLSPKSSHSGETRPTSAGHSPSMSRNSEAQSWTFEEQFRQLYSAGNETDRRSFLDSLFSFMQEQGTPISRLPIMAKRVLDLYTLYKLVIQRGGIVAVITKKLWQEIIRGLGLPPSITSAAFTLRTQYVKYLYAYESRMNQFSTLDELNMAIAGNRREGRRNKSLMYSDMPPPGHPHHHHHQQHHQQQQQQQQQHGHPHSMMTGVGAGGVPPPPPSHHHHNPYANVLAAEDRFRHLAAAIIDNHHHAAAVAAAAGVGVDHPAMGLQSCSPPQQPHLQQQLDLKTTVAALQQTPARSPAAAVATGVPSAPPSSLYNGHQPSSYQHLQQQQQQKQQQHQQQQQQQPFVQSSNEQTNKQRELLSMLMWMDIVRANQTAMPRLPMPSLPSSPSAAAYTAAAALNLTPVYKGPMVTAAVPEQSEALNLGKKRRTSNNNNSESEDDGDSNGCGDDRRQDDRNSQDDGDSQDKGNEDEGPAAKRIKSERCSPPVPAAAEDGCGSSEDDGDDDEEVTQNGHHRVAPRPTVADVIRHGVGPRRSPSPMTDEDVVEMDINATTTGGPSGNNGLAICVTRRTKNGVYRGQLTKNSTHVNGGLINNANPFVLHLNGDLYTGHLKLQQQQQQTMTTDN